MTLLTPLQAAQALRDGCVVAYPTEAVYGLGCDPHNAEAVALIWKMKQRAAEQGLIILGASWLHLQPYMGQLSDEQVQTLKASWPDAMTWVVPASRDAPTWITGGRDTVAMRWTKQVAAVHLCQAFEGAIVSTSANIHGQSPCTKAEDVMRVFAGCDGFAGVCEGDMGDGVKPTPIRVLSTGYWIRT